MRSLVATRRVAIGARVFARALHLHSFRVASRLPLYSRLYAPQIQRPVSATASRFQPSRGMSNNAKKIVKIPRLGESIVDGSVASIVKRVGDFVNQDDIICVLETAKVSVDIRSPYAGRLEAFNAKEGDTVAVDAEIAVIDTAAQAASGDKPASTPASAPTSAAPASSSQPSTASTPQKHAWNGPRARTPEEAMAKPPTEKDKPAQSTSALTVASEAPAAAPKAGSRAERRVKMTRLRQTIAVRLKQSQNTLALLTTFNEVDMHRFMEIREKIKGEFQKKHKVKLGFMSIFVKAATAALQEFPDVNAGIDGDHIVYHDYVDLSVAVSSPAGLVVPVLRNTESMSFADVEKAIETYGVKAKKRELAMEDLVGGTFTISNGGVFGSMMGTPIVNPPQSAILGMHAITNRPVAEGDKIVIRPMMYLALTYDHRLIDGATAVTFLKKIKSLIEAPERLLFDA